MENFSLNSPARHLTWISISCTILTRYLSFFWKVHRYSHKSDKSYSGKRYRSLSLCGYLRTIQMEEISLAVRESRFTRVWWSVKMLLIRIAEAVESNMRGVRSFIHLGLNAILDSYCDCFCANLSFRITILQSGNILKARWVHLDLMLHTLLRNVYWFVLTSAVGTPVSIFPFISLISLLLVLIFLACGKTTPWD